MSRSRGWAVLWTAVILIGTLSPQPPTTASGPRLDPSLIPLSGRDTVDALLNIGLYVPLGIALMRLRVRPLRICVSGFLLTLAVELAQQYIPGRDASARDIAANTLGVCVAVAALSRAPVGPAVDRVFSWIEGRMRQLAAEPSAAARCSVLCAALAAAVFALPAYFAAPLPPLPVYYVSSPLFDAGEGPIMIGSTGPADSAFSGLIDEVRVYRRARSRDDIVDDMRQPVNDDGSRDPDLVVAYAFDDGAGSTAFDASGGHHSGSIRNARWSTDGRFGGALFFDGRSSQVIVQDSERLGLRDALTLEAWLNPAQPAARDQTVIARDRGWFLRASTEQVAGQVAAGGRFGGRYEDARSRRILVTNKWTHVAISYDGRTIALYINGVLAATNTRWSALRVRDVRLNGITLDTGRVSQSTAVDEALRGDMILQATLDCAASSSAGTLFHMIGPGDRTALSLRGLNNDLLVGVGTRAARAGLPSAWFRAPDALRDCPEGSAIDLLVAGRAPSFRVEVAGQSTRRAAPGPAAAWTLIVHQELISYSAERICCAALVALCIGPVAFFARRRLWTLAAAVIVTAALLFPFGDRIRGANLDEAAGAGVGAVAGLLLRRRHASTLRSAS